MLERSFSFPQRIMSFRSPEQTLVLGRNCFISGKCDIYMKTAVLTQKLYKFCDLFSRHYRQADISLNFRETKHMSSYSWKHGSITFCGRTLIANQPALLSRSATLFWKFVHILSYSQVRMHESSARNGARVMSQHLMDSSYGLLKWTTVNSSTLQLSYRSRQSGLSAAASQRLRRSNIYFSS